MLSNKKVNLLISFLLAIALWMYVINTVNPVQAQFFRGIEVEYVNEEVLQERNLVINKERAQTVDVEVKAARKKIAGMTSEDIRATVDVSELVPGDNIVAVNIETGNGVALSSNETKTIHIVVEEMVSEERYLEVKYDGATKSSKLDFKIEGPKTVVISGAKSLVEKTVKVAAVMRDSQMAGESGAVNAEIKCFDSMGRVVNGISFSQEQVKVSYINNVTKEVPLVIETEGTLKEGYEVIDIEAPETIVLKGSAKALKEIDEIKCEPLNVEGLFIDKDMILRPILPDGITSSGAVIYAHIHVADTKRETTADLSTQDIQITGLDEAYQAQITEDTIQLTSGSALKLETLTASIDLTGLEPGEHQVNVQVEGERSGYIKVSPEKVTVVISEKE